MTLLAPTNEWITFIAFSGDKTRAQAPVRGARGEQEAEAEAEAGVSGALGTSRLRRREPAQVQGRGRQAGVQKDSLMLDAPHKRDRGQVEQMDGIELHPVKRQTARARRGADSRRGRERQTRRSLKPQAASPHRPTSPPSRHRRLPAEKLSPSEKSKMEREAAARTTNKEDVARGLVKKPGEEACRWHVGGHSKPASRPALTRRVLSPSA